MPRARWPTRPVLLHCARTWRVPAVRTAWSPVIRATTDPSAHRRARHAGLRRGVFRASRGDGSPEGPAAGSDGSRTGSVGDTDNGRPRTRGRPGRVGGPGRGRRVRPDGNRGVPLVEAGRDDADGGHLERPGDTGTRRSGTSGGLPPPRASLPPPRAWLRPARRSHRSVGGGRRARHRRGDDPRAAPRRGHSSSRRTARRAAPAHSAASPSLACGRGSIVIGAGWSGLRVPPWGARLMVRPGRCRRVSSDSNRPVTRVSDRRTRRRSHGCRPTIRARWAAAGMRERVASRREDGAAVALRDGPGRPRAAVAAEARVHLTGAETARRWERRHDRSAAVLDSRSGLAGRPPGGPDADQSPAA